MYRVTFTQEQIYRARERGKERSAKFGYKDTPHSDNFFEGKPHWYRNYIGCLGEIAYSEIYGFDVQEEIFGFLGDDGFDFADGADAKASPLHPNKPNLLIRKDAWGRKIPKFYCMFWLKNEERVAEMLGSITREDADRLKYGVNYKKPSWRIDYKYLEIWEPKSNQMSLF